MPPSHAPSGNNEGWIKTTSFWGGVIQDWTDFAWAINPTQLIADYFIGNNTKIDVVIAPDKGAYEFAKEIADKLNADSVYIDAHRSRKDATRINTKNALDINLSGKRVLIPDDWILTGSKVKNAIELLKKRKDNSPAEIHVGVIHGELTGNAYKELADSGIRLHCSNTIKNPEEKIDITPLLAERIKNIFID